ncbi:MAG: phosphate starvation-inducible protein PsiE [Acidimicrobiales bacterium]|nr:MAG: phosphate starvation-inducible protein PsiE [Acidimicrobiales bacterium]
METTSPGTRLDSLGMFAAASSWPDQLERALDAAAEIRGLPDHDEIESVVVLGMGGSGIAGDVAAAVAGPFMPVPLVVHKGYEAPAFVSASTLVFAVSFSGETEETLESASMAAMAGGRMVAISKGGRLAELAREWGAPHIRVPDGIPQPRAGLAALVVPILDVLGRLGFFPGARDWVAGAVEHLRRRIPLLESETGPAAALAADLAGTFPLIYGGGSLGGVAALRWKTQLNENAKVPAFANCVPELMHNEICGWGQHGDVTRQVMRLVLLRHDQEHPQVERRFELLLELMREVVSGIDEVWAQGEGVLAQLLDLIVFGDFVSLHLAARVGLDPGPVPVLEEIKQRLRAPT